MYDEALSAGQVASNFRLGPDREPAYLVADANADGRVDVADLGILATNYNDTPPAPAGRQGGDFNVDGAVDVEDLGILATQFGQPAGAPAESFGQALAAYPALAAAAVPEPATWCLPVLGALCLLVRRRRGR
jgi:hypothetical protein